MPKVFKKNIYSVMEKAGRGTQGLQRVVQDALAIVV
jgi:hypothetical protein